MAVGSGDDVAEGTGVLVGAGVEVDVDVGFGVRVNGNVGVAGGGLGDSNLAFGGEHAERTKLAIATRRKLRFRFICSLFNASQPGLKHNSVEANAPIAQNGYLNRLCS